MAGYEIDENAECDLGRYGVKLPKLDIKEGDFYPHDTVEFLQRLWELNEVGDKGDNQLFEGNDSGYFVVPASEYKPLILALSETNKAGGQHGSLVTSYRFFTPPVETGELQLVMSFAHYGTPSSGFAGDREQLVFQDHEGVVSSLRLYGSRWHGAYQEDEFANYKDVGAYTYDTPATQQNLKRLAFQTAELKRLFS